MTNGEKIQQDFECKVCEPIIEDNIIHVIFADKLHSAIGFDWDWWNAEYKGSTTKNNLGFDCVSRQEVDRLARIYLKEPMDNHVAFYEDFLDLPGVTPIRPKGHWILVQRGKSIDICCSNCKAVRIKEYAYNYTIDQLDKEDLEESFECTDMRYCPNCGADMREVEK